MSSWRKTSFIFLNTSTYNRDFHREDSTSNEARQKQREKRNFVGRPRPLEEHWHLGESGKKKNSTLTKKLSFRSLQKLLTMRSKSKTFRRMFQGVRDPNNEKLVLSLRESLLKAGKLPEKHDDYHTLLRFLRMRGFDQLKAETMFVNMMKWREDNRIDEIEKEFKFEEYDAVKKCYPHGYHGVDKYGRPLYIERIGSLDLKTLLQVTTIERYAKYHITEQEKTLNLRYPACSLNAKRHIASITAIIDVKGLGTSNFSRPAIELFTEIQKIDSNYYPETLNQLFIINAGPGFKALWKFLTTFFEARTLSKIKVLGNKYLDKLSEVVDLSNLPDVIGGNCKCSEDGGCLLKDKGPWTDPEIKTTLMEVYNKAQKHEDEQTNEELLNSQNKTSYGRFQSNSIRIPPEIKDTVEPNFGNNSSKQDMQTTVGPSIWQRTFQSWKHGLTRSCKHFTPSSRSLQIA